MQTEMEYLTHRYTSLFSAFLKGIGPHSLALPVWLNALFDATITKPYIRGLKLLSKLRQGLYRLPRKRTSKRTTKRATTPKPPIFIPPDRPKTSRWMWLARILPTVMAPAAATYRAELQQLLSEPAMVEIFQAAPALRHHLRPLCRALGVTLPAEPLPPDAHGPEPEPPPAVLRPLPEIGTVVHGTNPHPPQTRAPWVHEVYSTYKIRGY